MTTTNLFPFVTIHPFDPLAADSEALESIESSDPPGEFEQILVNSEQGKEPARLARQHVESSGYFLNYSGADKLTASSLQILKSIRAGTTRAEFLTQSQAELSDLFTGDAIDEFVRGPQYRELRQALFSSFHATSLLSSSRADDMERLYYVIVWKALLSIDDDTRFEELAEAFNRAQLRISINTPLLSQDGFESPEPEPAQRSESPDRAEDATSLLDLVIEARVSCEKFLRYRVLEQGHSAVLATETGTLLDAQSTPPPNLGNATANNARQPIEFIREGTMAAFWIASDTELKQWDKETRSVVNKIGFGAESYNLVDLVSQLQDLSSELFISAVNQSGSRRAVRSN